jgi:hypothetical protein
VVEAPCPLLVVRLAGSQPRQRRRHVAHVSLRGKPPQKWLDQSSAAVDPFTGRRIAASCCADVTPVRRQADAGASRVLVGQDATAGQTGG